MKTTPEIIDLYFSGTTKADLLSAMESLGFATENDEGELQFISGKGFVTDYVGKIQLTPGTYDEQGNETTAPTFTEEVHLNVRLIDTPIRNFPKEYNDRASELHTAILQADLGEDVQLLEAPNTPARVFA